MYNFGIVKIVKITMKETITPCNALSLDLYFLFNHFQKPLKQPFFLKRVLVIRCSVCTY